MLGAAVSARAKEGAANIALIRLLSKTWRVPKSSVSIASGRHGRRKIVHIAGEPNKLAVRLNSWAKEYMTEAKIIDGKAFAEGLRLRVADSVATLKNTHGLTPGLAVILVGEDPASQVYTRNKARQTSEAGMKSLEHKLDVETSQSDLLALISQLNRDDTVNGILVQLPLPSQIDSQSVIAAIDPAKDVDGFHVVNSGLLATGGAGLVPCTPLGCLMLLKDALGELSGTGRSYRRTLQRCRKAHGSTPDRRKLHGNDRPLANARSSGRLCPRRHSGRGGRSARNDRRLLD